ncbi:MAG: type VI secretion protein IcmF/TssM N-terminal domain-containing protein [Phycisphaerales bacterium]
MTQHFGQMSPPVKAAVVLASGGGLLAAMSALFSPRSIPIIAGGLVLIALLFLGYKFALKWWEKRKASPMEKAIKSSAAATPTGIAEPAKRARLDDLRKSFDTGVEKFRAAGKNLYSLPWFALVGEPGSGKTEAIRHCNVGFPPGLQDQLQGAGGTVNMNWWFTNHAVILDTAGRLMFEEVDPGATNEWGEFLKLLKKVRPNCPINGMLLVIPAESLIRDTADAIERKAGKIASQLDQIQRALGVRFPVFVVITKCDLINGFREFFDEVTDPTLQHQIMGWSNPSPLDTPFSPEMIDQHLRTVQQRLVRRRMALLQDPVNTEDSNATRTAQVDALFAFPESLMKIGPRLRRYLEMIFVAGEWSAKPLFLRGIYFTSSMREGTALDADLADALGMPVEALPEGRVWERERAYFLRDLFLQKVFRERGLVTRASNTSAHLKQRRAIVYGTGIVGSLLLLGFTVLASRDLTRNVEKPSRFWEATGQAYMTAHLNADGRENNTPFPGGDYYNPLVWSDRHAPPFSYIGDDPQDELTKIAADERNGSPGRFPLEVQQQAEAKIHTPFVFSLWGLVAGRGSLNFAAEDRQKALGVIVEESVLRPTVEAARIRLKRDMEESEGARAATPTLRAENARALAELVRVEVAAVRGARTPATKLADVMPFVFRVYPEGSTASDGASTETRDRAVADAAALQKVIDWTYAPDGGKRSWPPPTLVRDDTVSLIKDGVTKLVVNSPPGDMPGGLADVQKFVSTLDELERAEKRLHELSAKPADQRAEWWTARYADVTKAGREASELAGRVVQGRSLEKAYADERQKNIDLIKARFAVVADQLRPVIGDDGEPVATVKEQLGKDKASDARVQTLKELNAVLKDALAAAQREDPAVEAMRSACRRADVVHLASAGATSGEARHPFLVRLKLYELAAGAFAPAPDESALAIGALTSRIQGISNAAKQASDSIDLEAKYLPQLKGDGPEITDAAKLNADGVQTAKLGASVAGVERAQAVVRSWIDALSGTPEEFDAKVAGQTRTPTPLPQVPLTATSKDQAVNPSYDTASALAVLGDCQSIAGLFSGTGTGTVRLESGSELAERAQNVKASASAYGQRYLAYWRNVIGRDIVVRSFAWSELVQFMRDGATLRSINKPLNEMGLLAADAFEKTSGLIAGAEGAPSPQVLAQQARSSLSNLTDPTFTDPIEKLFTNWATLAPEAGTARLAVLASYNEGKIRPGFVWTIDSTKQSDFIERYWADFSLKALTALASEAGGEVPRAMQYLRSARKFPIVKPGPEGTLSVAELMDAREKLRVASDAAKRESGAASPAAPGQRPLPADVQDQVDKLRGTKAIDDADRILIAVYETALRCLPETAEQRLACKIEKFEPPDEKSTATATYKLMTISPKDAPPVPKEKWVYVHLTTEPRELAASVASIDGTGVVINFYFNEQQGLDPAAAVTLDGPWSPQRLLLDPAVSSEVRGAGKEWFTKVKVVGGSHVWLKLTFDKDLPDVKKWRGE